jgi:dimethylglycine catabolism A
VDDEAGFSAPTVAEALVERGWQVEIVSTLTSVGAGIDPTQLPFVLARLDRAGVRLSPNLECLAGEPAGVILRHVYSGERVHRHAVALIVIAGHRRGVTDLRAPLLEALPQLELHVVGDALSPRTLLDAVAEGARAGATAAAGRAVTAPSAPVA